MKTTLQLLIEEFHDDQIEYDEDKNCLYCALCGGEGDDVTLDSVDHSEDCLCAFALSFDGRLRHVFKELIADWSRETSTGLPLVCGYCGKGAYLTVSGGVHLEHTNRCVLIKVKELIGE